MTTKATKIGRTGLLIVAVVSLLGIAFTPAAAAQAQNNLAASYSCNVTTDEDGSSTCEFRCTADKLVTVDGDAQDGKVSISASCGGSSVGCDATQDETGDCPQDTEARTDDAAGICDIETNGNLNDEGTGTCSGEQPDEQDCTVGPVNGECVEDYITDPDDLIKTPPQLDDVPPESDAIDLELLDQLGDTKLLPKRDLLDSRALESLDNLEIELAPAPAT